MLIKYNHILVGLVLSFAIDHQVLGSPDGAPDAACSTLKPSHSGSGQEGSGPFDIVLSQQEYLPGDTIQGKY